MLEDQPADLVARSSSSRRMECAGVLARKLGLAVQRLACSARTAFTSAFSLEFFLLLAAGTAGSTRPPAPSD